MVDIPPKIVLVAEDEAAIVPLMKVILEGEGYQTEIVGSAEAALAKIDAGLKPNLLVTDFGLEGAKNGAELAKTVRQRFPQLPIVMVTGNSNAQEALGELARTVPIVSKPFKISMFSMQIKEAIRMADAIRLPAATHQDAVVDRSPDGGFPGHSGG